MSKIKLGEKGWRLQVRKPEKKWCRDRAGQVMWKEDKLGCPIIWNNKRKSCNISEICFSQIYISNKIFIILQLGGNM